MSMLHPLQEQVKQEPVGLVDLNQGLLQQQQHMPLHHQHVQQQQQLQQQQPLDRLSDQQVLTLLGTKLRELKLSAFQVENWFLIQRRSFDARILDEPYHAIQLLVNFSTGQYLHRVWGRTKDKGFLGGVADLELVCWRTFHLAVPCTGYHLGNDEISAGSSSSYFLSLEYPFRRRISRNCALTYQQQEHELPGASGLCAMCFTVPRGSDGIVPLEEPVKEEEERDEEEEDMTDPTQFLEKIISSVPRMLQEASAEAASSQSSSHTRRRLKAYVKVGGKKVFQCHHEECKKVYYNGRSLLIHLKNFHLFGPFECLACQTFTCQYAQDLHEHVMKRHPNLPFRCPICAVETAPGAEDFSKHYLECWRLKRRESQPKQKPKEKKHQCELCGKTFPKERLLNEHRNWHRGAKPLKCNECDFATCYLSSLYSHNQKHLREKGVELTASSVRLVFRCDLCEKSFGRPNILRQHKKIVHDGIRDVKTCEHCGLTFPNKSQWRRHTLKEHSKAPRFPCPICKANCIDRYELNIHMRVHKDPEFICRFCGKAVKSKQSLLAHERSHTGENPFKCDLCEYTCKASSVLCKHKVLKHKQQQQQLEASCWDKGQDMLLDPIAAVAMQ